MARLSGAPQISVVIPLYNAAGFIREAMDSVLAQSGFTLEVIVVDNRSTDGGAQIVGAAYGNRVTLIDEPRPGAAHARNTGVHAATGEYLAFLDADDLWEPHKLAKQFAELVSRPEIELVFCHALEFPATPADQPACRPGPIPWLAPSALFCRRETFLRAGDLPDVAGGEFIAWYGLAQANGIKSSVLEEVLVRRRVHASNLTRDPRTVAGYLSAAKWLFDQKRKKTQTPSPAADS